jgi:hypothetical protein
MRIGGLAAAAGVLLLSGCVGSVAYAPAGSFAFGSRSVPITRETVTVAGADGVAQPRVYFFVVSNGERYTCDGTEAGCRAVYLRAEEVPRGPRGRHGP